MLTLVIYFIVKLGLLQLYPAYICYKALKVNNQQEFASLLTFWVVSISYLAMEYFSDLFLFWIPFYTEMKLIIVLWLILPQTQGASVFYVKYLDPFLHQHEEHIDNVLLEIQAKLRETILLYGKQLIEFIKKLVVDTIGLKGHSSSAQEQQVASAAASSMTTPPPENTTHSSGIIMNPYNLFSTLILSTTQRFQQQQQQATLASPTPVIVTPPPPVNTTTGDITTVDTKLDRIDSHDSLNSFVNVNKSSSNGPTPELTTIQQQQGWTGYLSSFVWNYSSDTGIDAKEKRD